MSRLRDILDRIEARQEKATERLAHYEGILERQQTILEEHMRRTEANETHVALMERKLSKTVTWPFLGKLLTSAGAILGLMKALKLLH